MNQYLNDHVHVEVPGVQANSLVERGSLNIIQVHCHVHLQVQNSASKLKCDMLMEYF
jgi:hypothetical protein